MATSTLEAEGYKLISLEGDELIAECDGIEELFYRRPFGFAGWHLVHEGDAFEFIRSLGYKL